LTTGLSTGFSSSRHLALHEVAETSEIGVVHPLRLDGSRTLLHILCGRASTNAHASSATGSDLVRKLTGSGELRIHRLLNWGA
jgi:type IV pilus biogenesis protein CpaD/CtpE